MAAVFVIDQPGGAGSGAAGVSRDNLWIGKPVHLTCTSSESSYQWDLLDASGSSVPSDLGDVQSIVFTPDVWATYRVRLTTNNGASTSIRLLATSKDINGVLVHNGWRKFAFDEQPEEANFSGNQRGYAAAWDSILSDLSSPTFDVVHIVASDSPYTPTLPPRRLLVVAANTHLGDVSVVLPAVTDVGVYVIVKDAGGHVSEGLGHSLSVSGTGQNIDDHGGVLITTNYQSLRLVFDGTQWLTV